MSLIANLNVSAGCPSNQHLEGQACVSNSRSCSVLNGSGTQSWIGSSWSSCQISTCNADYYPALSGISCDPITYVAAYSTYSPPIPTNQQACDGTVNSQRSIESCSMLHNGLSAPNFKCALFSPDNDYLVVSQSPAGSIINPVLGGQVEFICDKGEDSLQATLNITCNTGFPNYTLQDCSGSTVTQLVISKSLANTSSGPQGLPLVITPNPISVIALDSSTDIYTFSSTSTVSVSVVDTPNVLLESFGGDCSGTSCSLSMSSSKSIVVNFKGVSKRFTLVDLNDSPVLKCIKGDGTDLTSIFGESKILCENPNKNLSWISYTCEDITDQNECMTHPNCSYNMGGGGGFNFQCYDQFDEFSCQMMSDCMWDSGMNQCNPLSFGQNQCTGGIQSACKYVDNNSFISSLNDTQCNSEYVTGISVATARTQNGLTDNPYFVKQGNNLVTSVTEKYDNYSYQFLKMKIATIDLTTYSSILEPADSTDLSLLETSHVIDGNVISVGNNSSFNQPKIYKRTSSGISSVLYEAQNGGQLYLLSKIGSDRALIADNFELVEVNVNSGTVNSFGSLTSYYRRAVETQNKVFMCLHTGSGFKITEIVSDINAPQRLVQYSSNSSCAAQSTDIIQLVDYANDKIIFSNSQDGKLYLASAGTTTSLSINKVVLTKPFVSSLGDVFASLKTTGSDVSDSFYKVPSPLLADSASFISDINVGSNEQQKFIGEINGKIIYSARYTNAGSSPWKIYSYDYTSNTITDLMTVNSDGFPSLNDGYLSDRNRDRGAVLNGKLYYISSSNMFETDGTVSGTKAVEHPAFPFDGFFMDIQTVGNKIAMIFFHNQKGKEVLLFDPLEN